MAHRYGADRRQRLWWVSERHGPDTRKALGMTSGPVVTGIGVVAPNGLSTDEYWAATCAGRSGIGRVTRFDPTQYPTQLAGEVLGFRAEVRLSSRLVTQTDHVTRMALVAADMALADAGVLSGDLPEFDVGVV